jgi:hypothetical protein
VIAERGNHPCIAVCASQVIETHAEERHLSKETVCWGAANQKI